ncbi:flagellar hook-associated protein FlgK [Limisphaera ngatamarikiensis]|uniref:Flagellar hook-associated protein 1 n=1 Tax=Limisphaera ngatamarikiensis TaxID=1324935 RepID=A0A6M1RVL1_9BACT|nr:flagellar hook-associated protein FlgK [Limisphaera ngatamarikiensis]NGO39394.1 flagellar hook-associated protein FlgK [Limisphaera ngatamarikiensis]
MLGLFGSLNLGTRALQAQQLGVEVAGQNLANINNPAYARQKVQLQTAPALPSLIGPQGTGVEAIAIRQIRNQILDAQILAEVGVGGYWSTQQTALQTGQAILGEQVDRQAQGLNESSAVDQAGTVTGLAVELTGLFNAFRAVATRPDSLPERQVLVNQAQSLAIRFNQISGRLDDLTAQLNQSLATDVARANQLLADIARLNDQIVNAELPLGGIANDLRDTRQQKLEELARILPVQTTLAPNGTVTISFQGVTLVSDRNVLEQIETYDPGNGRLLLRTTGSATPLDPGSGTLAGTLQVRDGALAQLRNDLDTLAAALITEINNLHRTGYSLDGQTGIDFFTGTDARTIAVHADLLADPARVQASNRPDAPGNNSVALALAQLADQPIAALNNRTFTDSYSQTVANLGLALRTVNGQVADHQQVLNLLQRQRESVSGVSLDEEMTDLIRFQKAYQASARFITTIDELLDTVLALKR